MNDNPKYEKQISSLNAKNDEMRMEFETMQLHTNTVQETNETLKNQLFKAQSKIYQLQTENDSLKQQNQSHLNEITLLKQQIKLLSQNNDNDENKNNMNEIKWNFNLSNSNDTNNNNNKINNESTSNTNNVKNTRKRPRSDSSEKEYINENSEYLKKPKLTCNSGSTSTSISRSGSMDLGGSQQQNLTSILEKRLPTNLDLLRGDILAEAGCDDQISYCFNELKKCSTEEWQLRNFLMQMICGLCEETQECIQVSIIWDSRHIIKKQLTDLRSAIVKTTCEMLICFSKCCDKSDKSRFGQCLSFFIPIHLQGLYVTIQCIRDAHNECLSQCIENTQSFKCITPLLKGLQNKHEEVRVKVINLLSSLIISFSNNNNNNNTHQIDKKFEKYADAIGNTIKTYLTDSKPSVRNAVKKLFEQFAKAFPSKSKSLLARMDSNSQKTLRKCIGNNNDINNKKTQYKRQTSSGYGQTRTRRK